MLLLKYTTLLVSVVHIFATPIEPKVSNEDYRLPSGAIETEHYDIELQLDADVFETNKFKGIVSVFFKNLISTSTIKIHENNLEITKLTLQIEDGDEVTVEEWVSDNVTNILTITAPITLEVDVNYVLNFEYIGQLRTDEMYGFYKSYYINPAGETRYLGTTQFQPTHARKAFPCFDEPSYKATFDIKIKHPSEYSAVSNAAVETIVNSTENDVAFSTTSFARTPKMSTYLIAFVVSDFTCDTSEELIDTGVPHIVCSRDEEAENRQVALEAGPKLTHILEEYTGIKYSYSNIAKMHEFAIPDFSAGAMENWGLITYRETGLLWDPEESSNSNLQSIKNVIAHEIAHMWFGNLVTCHWWKDTFLNEGFARYFQYHATAELDPSYELEKQFVTAQIHTMLALDASETSLPLSYEVYTPTQVSNRFASVSYNKGASIIRWLMYILGYDNFKKGIQNYLKENEFDNSRPEDLWSALNAEAPSGSLPDGTTLEQVVENWVVEAGFPLLNVVRNGNDIIIKQQRFLNSGTSTTKWYVPITYTLSSDSEKFTDTSTRIWMTPDQDEITLSNVINDEDDWIILNNQQIGYYRINYDNDLLQRISKALESTDFGGIIDINRAQLVDDFANLARIGTHSYSHVLDLFMFLRDETSYYPWVTALTAFSNMLTRTGDEEIRDMLSAYIATLIQALYNSHPFDSPNNDEQIYTFNRVQAITWACRLGIDDCVSNALEAFRKFKESSATEKPDKNLKTVVYCNGLRHSEDPESDWNFLWDQYQKTKLAADRTVLISALGCAKDVNVLTRYLEYSIDSTSGIRQQDASSVFSAVYSQNPEGVDVAFDFLLANHESIANYYGSMNALSSLFSGLAGRFNKEDQIKKLDDFLNENSENLGESLVTSAQTALQTARDNLAWTQKFEEELNLYFRPSSPSTDPPPTNPPPTNPPPTNPPPTNPPPTNPPPTNPPPTNPPPTNPPTTPSDDGNTADTVSVSFTTLFISFLVFIYKYCN